MTLGEKLKMLSTGQRLSQRELAERLGVAKYIVSYYETGDRCPSFDVLIKIADVFCTTTDFFVRRIA